MENKGNNKIVMEITNEKLEAAIREYGAEPTNEKLTAILNMLRTTVLLVPAMLKAPNQPVPCFLKNANGEAFLPVYTSKNKIPSEPKSQAVLGMPFPACNSLVAKAEMEVVGMVINPFGESLLLKKELVNRLHEADKKAAQNQQVKLTPEQARILAKKQVEFGILPKRLIWIRRSMRFARISSLAQARTMRPAAESISTAFCWRLTWAGILSIRSKASSLIRRVALTAQRRRRRWGHCLRNTRTPLCRAFMAAMRMAT